MRKHTQQLVFTRFLFVTLACTLILGLSGLSVQAEPSSVLQSILENMNSKESMNSKSDQPTAAAASTPQNQPTGTPDSDFVKQMESLFAEQESTQKGATAQGPSRGMTIQGMAIKPSSPKVSIWTDRSSYYSGDQVKISFQVPETAYAYILNIDSQGEIRLVFPNRWDQDARFKEGTYTLPRSNRYSYPVSGPTGHEYVLLFASSNRISLFDRLADRGGEFPLVSNTGQLINELRDWVRSNSSWSAFAWNTFQLQNRYNPPVVRNQAPVVKVQASTTKVTTGSAIWFTSNGTSDPDGRIVEYNWDFNNDGRADAKDASARWVFNTPGTYTVRLTVKDNQGATASTTIQIVVEAPKSLLVVETDKNMSIYLNGAYIGRESVKQMVSPGTYTVTIKGSSQQEFTSTVNVLPGMKSVKLEISF